MYFVCPVPISTPNLLASIKASVFLFIAYVIPQSLLGGSPCNSSMARVQVVDGGRVSSYGGWLRMH
jgi:hypothetical protein